MEPPTRPLSSRRTVSVNVEDRHDKQNGLIRDVSPSPVSPKPSTSIREGNMDTRSSRSTRLSSLRWDEGEAETAIRDDLEVEIELAECVETRTVTTTTTTKRSYPSIHIRQSRPLKSLDIKEYPLAQKPTPPELSQFRYIIDGDKTVSFREVDKSRSPPKNDTSDLSFDSPISNESQEIDSKVPHGAAQEQINELPIPYIKASPGRIPHINTRTRPQSVVSQKEKLSPAVNASRVRANVSRQGRYGVLERNVALFGPLPATPETSELNTPDHNAPTQNWSSFHPANGPPNGADQNISPTDESSWTEAPSPASEAQRESFNDAVATPPVAESDLEPFDVSEVSSSLSRVIRRAGRSGDIAASSNASLPSPRLSPTLAAAQLHSEHPSFEDEATTTKQSLDTSLMLQESARTSDHGHLPSANLLDTKAMIETFDTMSDEMKSFMMYQFLKRCTRKTLVTIASVVNPALKCDFLDRLPPELSYHILSYLNHNDLCRAAQVSKRWRNIIDTNETGWKELMDRDGFLIPTDEIQRAITQGWGWQDPHGIDSCEKDISGRAAAGSRPSNRGSAGEASTHGTSRSSKRKRAVGLPAERTKRRALSRTKAPDLRKQSATLTDAEKVHKSEGPTTAASAAALAVPNPEIGLSTLRELHLFKSLYRRHYLLQQNWTNRDIKPHHMAFAAHPRFVITCLQFDDDKILTGSDDTLIQVWDTNTGALRKKLEGHEGGVWALQYEGNVLVSGSTDRSVRVWDIEKGLCTHVFQGHTSTVRCLQILMPTPTGTFKHGQEIMKPEVPLIITGSRDSQLRVWKLPEQGAKRYLPGPSSSDVDCPYFVRVLAGHQHSVRAIAAHGDTLVSGSYDYTVRVWRISDGETLHRLTGHTNKVYSVVLDKDRNRCISGSMDCSVKIWSLETGACLYTLEGHTSLVGLLDLYDNRLVSAAADSTLRIWDPKNGECKHSLTAHTAAITCFQHDGTKVISGSDRTLKMWNVKTGECMQDLLTDLSGVWQVRFDQRRCVAAVQRNQMTFIEILDFGAIRDGVPAGQRGQRILVDPRTASLGREEISSAIVIEDEVES